LAEEHLTNEMGKHPSIKQISEYLGGEKAGFPEIKIIDLKRIAVTPISLEKELKDDEDSHIADFIKDDTPTPMDQVANDEMRKQIIDFLKSELDNEEYKVYTMRFGFDQESAFQQLSLDEVSKKLKFTKDKVRTIETKAKRKLQNSKSLGAMKKLFHNMYSSSQEENE
jgi:RNA polymerase primary sigma factor